MCSAPEKAIISANTSAFPSATISKTSLNTVGAGATARVEGKGDGMDDLLVVLLREFDRPPG